MTEKIEFDFQGLLFAGIIIGSLGAVMDVSMSVASSDNTLFSVLNLDFITTEVVRSLAGSIGLIMTIPLTAFITGYMEKIQYNKDK